MYIKRHTSHGGMVGRLPGKGNQYTKEENEIITKRTYNDNVAPLEIVQRLDSYAIPVNISELPIGTMHR